MWIALRAPSGVQRGTRKQDRPAVGLRQHQEGVAHGRRHEPFVAGEAEDAASPSALTNAARVMLARRSEPPWFSVIAMPNSAPVFSRGGRGARDRSCARRCAAAIPAAARGACRERRDRAVGHGDRAIDPALHLRQHVGAGSARHVRAGLGSAQGLECRPCGQRRWSSARARPDGTRPRRAGGRSGRSSAAPARLRLASKPSCTVSGRPRSSPSARSARTRPSRRARASPRRADAWSRPNRLYGSSGGG